MRLCAPSIGAELRRPRRLLQLACPCRHISSPGPQSVKSLLYPQENYADGSRHTVHGYIRSVRKQKNIAFAALGDGSTLDPLQVVLTPDQAQHLSTGSAVAITGEIKKCPPGAKQSHELVAETATLVGEHDAESYPLQKKFHSLDFLRTIPHLRCRSPYNALLLRLRSQVLSSATRFFEEHDFVQAHPPIISSSDCEGAGEVFTVQPLPSSTLQNDPGQFFKTQKYLTVSSQLHLEALAQSLGKVWAISPTFRAEKSDTPRHLSEFYMLEVESTFTEDLSSVMKTAEQMLQSIATRLLGSQVGQELLSAQESKVHNPASNGLSRHTMESRWLRLQAGNWPQISYTDAVSVLQGAVTSKQAYFEFEPHLGGGLQAEHEKYLAERVGENGPVFVTDYPRDIKAFYMAPSAEKAKLNTVACFDLIVPDLCEIAGGSLREHRLAALLGSMETHGLLQDDFDTHPGRGDTERVSRVPESLKWYVDLRRYGSVPHGGFGLGFDRLLCYLAGVASVRDMVTFPRYAGRCDC